ncbi:S8 family serine peptidase [Flavobacterium sp. N1719]|uniref:S8 family serine peptidase n=1 Tax=Flavobacterium sp. N1719 TaxID=2885633 RepID=UPI0022234D68|nr:S8 family serine peptidase [Flavobacterium sp. N1719]
MKKIYLPLLFVLGFSTLQAQTPKDVAEIVSHYDLDKLKERQAFYQRLQRAEKAKAEAAAKVNGWPLTIENADGSFAELMKLTPDGYPMYFSTDNVAAAKTTRTNFLHTGGGMGLNLNGENMTVRVWDGGMVRTTHNAFGGRVSVIDNPNGTLNSHSTHVTGTMVASANPATVKGMAPAASARTFEWTDDESEALSEIQLGMLVSNHSYGVPISSGTTTIPGWIVGAYISDAYAWDEIAYNSPYYLQVASAGNEGDSNANTDPLAPGYDKLTTNKVCKNNLVVANCQDVTSINATTGAVTGTISINSSSSQGPTDDFRIKPDITGNGTSLTSTNSTSNTAVTTMTGTSMASPNVAGTLILFQQHYKNLYNSFMRAATLKGLACHTADDAGNVGPDATFGWGLLNAKKAVETLTGNGLTSWVSEENLNQGQTFTMNVNASGTTPLMASITWTDLPGNMNTSTTPNEFVRALVNDLDIRITRNGTTYYPWKLTSDPSAPAVRTGDNNVDNVELVKIDTPTAGQYTITITHKGNLVSGSQKYSLVITGLSSTFALNSTSTDQLVCANQTASYTFNYTQSGSGTTTFSAAGLPSGASASFSPSSLSAAGTVTMTVTGLSNAVPGEYFVGITGNNGTETETRYKTLRIFNAAFQPVALNSPSNGQTGLSTSAVLKWNLDSNAENYTVQVSTDSAFSSFLVNESTTLNRFTVTGLAQATRYFWRIIPTNRCGNGVASSASVFSFDTGTVTCDQTFDATDFSDASIASVANSSASVPLTITGGYTIGDINVNVNITHTYIQDMTITLQGPASIGSPNIILLQEACGDNDDMNCTFDDDGVPPSCVTTAPSLTGPVAPVDSLSSLNSLPADGDWILNISDPWNGDGGTVNAFSIDLCRVSAALATPEVTLENVRVFPNPTNELINVLIPNSVELTQVRLYDLQGREVLNRETHGDTAKLNVQHLSEGVYIVRVENSLGSTSQRVVIKK